jgi:hypothetical protein
MAKDINCPMCGKANPAGSVTCQFCGARIVPVGSAPSTASETAAPSNPTPEEDTEGWLRRLRGETPAPTLPPAPTNPPAEQPVESAPQEDEIPDWLARIRERSRAETSQPEPEEGQSSEAEAGSDWLANPSAPAEKTTSPTNANDDWLTRLRTSDETNQAPAVPENNWQSITPESTENNADESSSFASPDQLRDWLNSLGDEKTQEGKPPVREEKKPPPPTPVAAEQPAGSNDVPDWLREFDTETPAASMDSLSDSETSEIPGSQPARPENPLSIPPVGQIPDWLAAFENPETATPATAPTQEQPSPAEPQSASAGPFVSGQDEWSQLPAGEVPSVQNESELPDWLKNVTSRQAPPKPETPAPAETPAWLAVFDSNKSAPPVQNEAKDIEAQPSEEPISPFTGEDLPQWLSENPVTLQTGQVANPAAGSGLGEEGIPRLPEKLSLGEDEMPSLPDWLGEAQGEESAQATASTEGIEPAQLPGWLQAMRPVEAVVADSSAAPEDDQRAERSGPLVGLRGLLSGENLVTQYQKPPTISVKLRVSDKQRLNASLLENILAGETQSKPLRKERTRAPQTVVRVLVGLFLIAVLAITLFSSGGPAGINTPILYQAETVQFNSLINSLPDGAPVLLAFDYEASLSGEMSVSAAPVIDHLVAKQARLALVSTIPAGPILGQQLIEAAAQKQPGYSLANKTINLGYLAGGATSLQEFALNPQKAAPYALNATEGDVQTANAWENQALLGVNKLQDFAAVIVITDNSETGRSWVEQVQPNLGNTPMLVVVSAQAGPVMQPYFESSQVKGMVGGLAGGMTYEQLRQAPGTAHTYWSAFQAGLLTAMGLIIIGILFQGVLALFPPSKNKREA